MRQKSGYPGEMDKSMSKKTREEVLNKLRRRYQTAGMEYKRKLLTQAEELLGYHRKSAIRALGKIPRGSGPPRPTGRPVCYDPTILLPPLRRIWEASEYACGLRLAAMLPEWLPAVCATGAHPDTAPD